LCNGEGKIAEKMHKLKALDGETVKKMLLSAHKCLEDNISVINALNVYPVPDGDTGTNMLLTIRSGLKELEKLETDNASRVLLTFERGALTGARGNSGVILYQIISGLARGVSRLKHLSKKDLAASLFNASQQAYLGVSKPVEGTILTVIRDVSKAARLHVENENEDLKLFFEEIVSSAQRAVENTTALLKELEEAGVVDAGGYGLYTIFYGFLLALENGKPRIEYFRPDTMLKSEYIQGRESSEVGAERRYGHCTEFILRGDGLNRDRLEKVLKGKGTSLILAESESAVRVHIHTDDPDSVLQAAKTMGTLSEVHSYDMESQYRRYRNAFMRGACKRDTAILAVSPGEGFSEIFLSLGASSVIPASQVVNRGVEELLKAVEELPCRNVIIIPSQGNLLSAVREIGSMTKKKVMVVPAETVTQGIAAVVAFNDLAEGEENYKLMCEAISEVRTVEVTRTVHSEGKVEYTASSNGTTVAKGHTPADTLIKALLALKIAGDETVTIYYGEGQSGEDAENMREELFRRYPDLELEVLPGGQSFCEFILSVEQ